MSIINNLNVFTPISKSSFETPVKHRRTVFCKSLKKQISLINGDETTGRKWWKDHGDEVTSCLRYSTTGTINLGDGTHFLVSSLDELKDVYLKLIEEVSHGDYDELLENHLKKSSNDEENTHVV